MGRLPLCLKNEKEIIQARSLVHGWMFELVDLGERLRQESGNRSIALFHIFVGYISI